MAILPIELGTGGINVDKLFISCYKRLNTYGSEIEKRINTLTSVDKTIQQTEMLAIQFEIGQYNSLLEMTSSISKSLTDMMKTLAQRSN